ncbi:hypothetical protein F66182_1901 [Fusarium sp. NRRL 66182]|nr:hypothetical protein F66182_1901 [Fusarium sp. NRRL 66182]
MSEDVHPSLELTPLCQLDYSGKVHPRTLRIYPSTPAAASLGPSENTAITGITTRVSDYGRDVRQRNEAGEASCPEPRDDILAGLEDLDDTDSISRPKTIRDEDLSERPRLPLKSRLNAALQPDKCNNEKRFLPSGDMKAICTHSSVHNELCGHFNASLAREYAAYVCNAEDSAREIFTILVLIGEVKSIPRFKNAGLVDDDLPFGGSEGQKELWSRRSKDKRPIAFFDYARDAEMMREFYHKQWWVHVPFLDRDNENRKARDYKLERGTVMPWTFVGVKIHKGGFGEVQQVKIHKDHHSFSQYEVFALKTLHQDGYEQNSFRQEIAAFRKMRPGPHLIELCATLEIGAERKFMLLFPWAEGGNLDDLMKQPSKDLCKPSQLSSDEFVRWIAIECRGLVEALGTIHYTRIGPKHDEGENQYQREEQDYGIHGDIKPANILHFSQEKQRHPLGTLKVADFGLIKFHSRASRTKRSSGAAYAASQTYRSPEHDIGQVMSKKMDTWALGCVFSELLTWVILRPEACKEYQAKRTEESSYSGNTDNRGTWREDNFFTKHIATKASPSKGTLGGGNQNGGKLKSSINHIKARVKLALRSSDDPLSETPRLKTSVSKWIQKLIGQVQHKKGPTFLTEFLEFIKSDMLHPERVDRADCKRALEFFDTHISRGEHIDWYFHL